MAVKRKIVLLGDSSVGKTSLIRRFVHDRFEDSYISTIGSKVSRKELKVTKANEEVDLTFMIWDILGRTGYTASHARMFAGAHGAILVVDRTRKETLTSLERYWIPLLFDVVENIPLVFAYNKSDLSNDIVIGDKELEDIALRYNIGLEKALPTNLATTYATSAKTGDNVENAFESLGHMMLSDKMLRDPIKELYENLVAEGIYRQTDKGTLIGTMDAIIVDFCEGFDDEDKAMSVLRQEVVRTGLNIDNPSKKTLFQLVEFLADAESEFQKEETVIKNKEKRLVWVRSAKE